MRDKGLLPGTFEVEAGRLAARRRGGGGAAGQPGGGVPRRPQGGQDPSRRGPDGGGQRASRHRLAACAGRAAGCRGTGALFLVAGSVRASIAPALVPATLMAAIITVALFAPLLVSAGVRVVGLLDRPSPRGQRVPRGREREVTGAPGGLGGDPAGADRRGGLHDPVPAVHARGRVASPARRADRRRSTSSPRAPPGSRQGWSTSWPPESTGAVVGLADTSVYGNFELDPYAAKAVVGEFARGSARPRGHATVRSPRWARTRWRSPRTPRPGSTPRWASRCISVSATAPCTSRWWSPSTRSPSGSRTPCCRGPQSRTT